MAATGYPKQIMLLPFLLLLLLLFVLLTLFYFSPLLNYQNNLTSMFILSHPTNSTNTSAYSFSQTETSHESQLAPVPPPSLAPQPNTTIISLVGPIRKHNHMKVSIIIIVQFVYFFSLGRNSLLTPKSYQNLR